MEFASNFPHQEHDAGVFFAPIFNTRYSPLISKELWICIMTTQTAQDGLREQLYRQTLHIVAEEGLENLTMRKLASAAGLAAPVIYQYYDSKQTLLSSCYERIDAELGRVIASALRAEMPHRHELEATESYSWQLWSSYWLYLVSDPTRTLFYWRYGRSACCTPDVLKNRPVYFRSLLEFVDTVDRKLHISAYYNIHVLLCNLIDGTLSAAARVFSGTYQNDDLTVQTIYQSVFQPVWTALHRCAQLTQPLPAVCGLGA